MSSIQRPHAALALAIHLAIGTAVTLPVSAFAESASVDANRTYDIAAGSLTEVLSRFASASGVALSFDASLTQGRKSSGLSGQYSIDTGFAMLLAGSQLQAVRQNNGVYLLVVSENHGALELGATSVSGYALGELTENTGSYTTGATSTATKMKLSIRETPQSISVITRQRMDDQHLNSISDVLKQTPGITMSQDGGERFNIYSRGSEISNYQFDGVTTYSVNQTRAMPQTLLDMAIYDHVEVLRGATGLMVGAGDPSGVVNLVRKRPTADFQAHVQGGAGSWDYNRLEADVSGPLIDSGRLRGRIVAAKQDNHTFMDWYTQDREVLYGVLEADVTDTTLVRFGTEYQKYGVTGAAGVPLLFSNGKQTDFSRSTSTGARWSHEDYETYNHTLTVEQRLPQDWELKLVANQMDLDRRGNNGVYFSSTGASNLNEATGDAAAQRYRFTTAQRQQGLDLNLQGPFSLLGREHQLIVGANYGSYRSNHDTYNTGPNDSYGNTNFNLYTWDNYLTEPDSSYHDQMFDIDSHQLGYFAATRLNPTDDLHVILGVRASEYNFDYSLTYTNNRAALRYKMKETGQVTPYAGIVYDLTDQQSIYASYTDIFKPQYLQDRTGAVLEPVTGSNYELGWKGEFLGGRLNANVATYLIKRDNLAVADTGYTVPGTTTSAYTAEKGAETKGYDLELAGELTPGWNVSTSYNHSVTRKADGTRTQTEYAADTFKLWSTYNPQGEWHPLTFGGGVNWTSPTAVYYSRYGVWAGQGDYAVVNAMARYKLSDHLSTTLNLDNLLDKKYYSGIGGNNFAHYGAPRNFTLNVRYDF